MMIEHFAGYFPFFLAPVQVRVLSVSESVHAYARTVSDRLAGAGLRVDCDMSDESVGRKVAKTHAEKIPARIVIGEKERDAGAVTLEMDDRKQVLSVDDAVQVLVQKDAVFSSSKTQSG